MMLLQCVNRRNIRDDGGWAERKEEGPILKLDAVVGLKAFGRAVSSTAHALLDKHGVKVGYLLVHTGYVLVLCLNQQSMIQCLRSACVRGCSLSPVHAYLCMCSRVCSL